MNPRVSKTLWLLVGATLVAALTSYAQGRGQFRGGGRQRFPAASLATPDSFDGGFQFCRLAYSGRAWATAFMAATTAARSEPSFCSAPASRRPPAPTDSSARQ